MEIAKKTWEKPQLVILSRGTPEENVLEQCKTMNPNDPWIGPAEATQATCASGAVNKCNNCQARGNSGS